MKSKINLLLIFVFFLIHLTQSIRISNEWVRFLKIKTSKDPNLYAKAVLRFTDNIVIYQGCNVY